MTEAPIAPINVDRIKPVIGGPTPRGIFFGGNASAVEEFLAWCENEHGLGFDYDHATSGTPLEIRQMLDSFFNVNRERLEQQRRVLLASA